MKVISMNIEDIKPYENNPRNNDEAVEATANSIKEFGWQQPIVVDKNNVIICGHTRLKAAIELGLKTAPVKVATELSDEQTKAYRLADNKTGELAEWNFDLLNCELLNCDIDMDQFGFEIEGEDDTEIIEDEVPEVEEETTSKLGDIWELGKHRLMCGDATNEVDTMKLLNSEKVDLYLTDPPYGVNYTGGERNRREGIKNDNLCDDDFRILLRNAFQNAGRSMKQGASFYIWHQGLGTKEFIEETENANLEIRQILIWNKNQFVFGREDYHWKHEPCLYGWKEGKAHYFIDDRTQATVVEDYKQSFNKMKKAELVKLLEEMHADKVSTTVVEENRPARSEEHPTMKPVNLIARLIKNSSKQGWAILDNFGGSGTTLIACEQLNRRCLMMELDPKYCDVIVRRWENLTGEKAKRLNE